MPGPGGEKKPVGRQKGWRKVNAKSVRLPSLSVEPELAEWLEKEMSRRRRSTLTDLVRSLLWEAKDQQEEGGGRGC